MEKNRPAKTLASLRRLFVSNGYQNVVSDISLRALRGKRLPKLAGAMCISGVVYRAPGTLTGDLEVYRAPGTLTGDLELP